MYKGESDDVNVCLKNYEKAKTYLIEKGVLTEPSLINKIDAAMDTIKNDFLKGQTTTITHNDI